MAKNSVLNARLAVKLWLANNEVSDIGLNTHSIELLPRRDIVGNYGYLSTRSLIEVNPTFERYNRFGIIGAKRSEEDDLRETRGY
jgi:hypothetical protein